MPDGTNPLPEPMLTSHYNQVYTYTYREKIALLNVRVNKNTSCNQNTMGFVCQKYKIYTFLFLMFIDIMLDFTAENTSDPAILFPIIDLSISSFCT